MPSRNGIMRLPAEFRDPRDVEQLARGAVEPARVPGDPTGEAGDLGDRRGQFADGEVVAATHVDRLVTVVGAQQYGAGRGEVVHVQEFPARGATAPQDDLLAPLGRGLVEAADERGQDVRRLQVEVVTGPIEIGRHGADVRRAVLAPVGLHLDDARDLGECVRLVGGLQRTGQQRVLADRLGSVLGVDAGRPEEEQAAHAAWAWAPAITLSWIWRFSSRNCTGWVLLAMMPPTFAAASTTASGRRAASSAAVRVASRRSSSARVRVSTSCPSAASRMGHGGAHQATVAGDEDTGAFGQERCGHEPDHARDRAISTPVSPTRVIFPIVHDMRPVLRGRTDRIRPLDGSGREGNPA